jgi:hypothetical protein
VKSGDGTTFAYRLDRRRGSRKEWDNLPSRSKHISVEILNMMSQSIAG